MSPSTLIGGSPGARLSREDRPAGASVPLRRYSGNPVTTREDAAAGRIAARYGCADTATGVAFGYVDGLVARAREDSL